MLQFLTLALAASSAVASPLAERRSGSTPVSTAVANTWKSVAQYASAAYCSPAHIKAWNCGTACNANPAPTKVYTTGGDNQANPYYYVIANSTTLIFAVAGTNPLSALSIGDDLDFGLTTPDTAYFPSNGGAQLHHGFYSAFTRLAADLTTAVQSGIDDGYTNVLVTGHSLGGAIGHQVAVYLQQKFPSLTVTARLFASPRVGNAAWANYVDSTLGSRAQHLINVNDIVPQVPAQSWGFQQSSNELWIPTYGSSSIVSCSGQENSACQDSLGLVGDITAFATYVDLAVHLGPYLGVTISSLTCPLI